MDPASDGQDVILAVDGLTKVFRRHGKPDIVACKDVGFRVRKGECLGIVGESGSGKSTIASMIVRMNRPTSGSIVLDGTDVAACHGRQLRELYCKVQMVFQNPAGSFDPRRTLESGVAEGMRNYRGMGRHEALEKARKLLEDCGLPAELGRRYAREVSGGQCQRAAIARAIALEPKLLICDEATSALDVTVQEQIMKLLKRIRKNSGMAMLFICHDIALAQEICDGIIVMHDGVIVERGSADEVIRNPRHVYTKTLIGAVLA